MSDLEMRDEVAPEWLGPVLSEDEERQPVQDLNEFHNRRRD